MWHQPPDWWALNDHPMLIRTPDTPTAGRTLTLPDEMGPGMWWVIECTHPDDHGSLVDGIDSGTLPLLLLDTIADRLCERIVGWKRWQAAHIWDQTISAWSLIEGEHLGRGVDITDLAPQEATNVVFAWWRTHYRHDPDGWKQWVGDMNREPMRLLKQQAATETMPTMSLAELEALQARLAPAQVAPPTSTMSG